MLIEHRRRFLLAWLGGMAAVVAGAIFMGVFRPLGAGLFLSGFLLLGGTMLYSQFWAAPCPGCARSLGRFIWWIGYPSDPPFRFCPFCGAELATPRKLPSHSDDLLS